MKLIIVLFIIVLTSISFSQQSTLLSYTESLRISKTFSEDIFSYFDLKEYDTQLKKKLFLRTSKAKLLKDSLQTIKSSLISRLYRIEMSVTFSNYSLIDKGFTLDLHVTYSFPEICGFWFDILPTKEVYTEDISGKRIKVNRLFILFPDEDKASEFEKKKLTMSLYFQIIDKLKTVYLGGLYSDSTYSYSYPKIKNVKMVIKDLGRIIFQRKF